MFKDSHRRLPVERRSLRSVGRFSGALVLGLLLGACGTNRFEQRPPAWGDTLQEANKPAVLTGASASAQPPAASAAGDADSPRIDPAFYKPGSGDFLRAPPVVADARPQADGDIKLNFQNANLLEVIKVILGDMLQINYTVDPSVQGTVSMQTTQALPREDLIPTLELLLRQNGAALITSDNVYRVVPLANALAETRAPQLGDSTLSLPDGFNVRVVPLRYVSADEMAQILSPFLTDTNQLMRVDSQRNLLILAGSGGNMQRLLETVHLFDVDRMTGMSVALFTPDFVDAKTLANDLDNLLADPKQGLMAGLVRFIVVERLNGLLVVTPSAEYLARVRSWIRRLDRDTGDASPRLFIYRVQNGKATDLAAVLSQLFNPPAGTQIPDAELAPDLTPVTIGQSTIENTPRSTLDEEGQRPKPPQNKPAPAADLSQGLDISQTDQVQVIADEPNNALLILARGSEYRQILPALRQLDVSPMQVLIEVTIAEVTLSDNLSFGVEWFFKNSVGSKTGIGTLDLGAAGIGAITPGFSYAITGGGGVVNFVLNTLATESNLSIISSPTLLVLNNQEATINVGQEIPVASQQQQSTIGDSNIINSIEYRDTGVILKIKPRVNAGGLVTMDVDQEISVVPTTNNADPLTPRIKKRKITSTVAVNSGNTIILGGLIQDNRDLSESGIPFAHKIPIIGALFGTKADNQERTELIVLITPRAISDNAAALQVTEDFRRRLQKLIPSKSEEAGTAKQKIK
ncbi:MAG: type II secretion system secretin GspD [Sedimenticolaceae bacterium]